jgi:TPR repeat protein
MSRYRIILAGTLLLAACNWAHATDATTAIPPSTTLQQQAAAGDAEAQAKLGLELIKSTNPADQSAAVEWFRKSAAQGNTDGEWNLGDAYVSGKGIGRDTATGLEWMRKSLSNGVANHIFEYAMLQRAFGGGSNQEAEEWLRKSAEAGSWPGMMFLAMAEQKTDPADARGWMLKAAQAGNPLPQMLVGWGYIIGKGMFDSPDIDAGLHWLRQSAQQGYAPAEGGLGLLLVTGEKNVPRNPAEGVRWAEKAAAQHDAHGYLALGYAYQLGNGKPVDPAKAWYNFAAAQRLDTKHELSNVSNAISLVATELTPAQIDQLQAEVAKIPLPPSKPQQGNMAFNTR